MRLLALDRSTAGCTPDMGMNLWGGSPLWESLECPTGQKKPLADGKGASARVGLKEAREQKCEATDRNRIEGLVPGRVGTSRRSPPGTRDRVNAALVHGQFMFLFGEICTASGRGESWEPD